MKLITHLYAIIICFILTIFLIAFIIITFPISIIGNGVRLICALLSKNFCESKYDSWIIFCKEGFLYIKRLYYYLKSI